MVWDIKEIQVCLTYSLVSGHVLCHLVSLVYPVGQMWKQIIGSQVIRAKKEADNKGKTGETKKRQMKEHYIYQEMASTEGARESPSTLSLELD